MGRAGLMVALWSLVLFVPLVCVWLGDYLFWTVTNRPERVLEAPVIAIVQSAIASLPFVLLALAASVRFRIHPIRNDSWAYVLAALVGIALTVGFWGLFYYDGYVYWRDEGTGGANIGLGLLILFSPLVVGCGMFFGYRVAAARRANKGGVHSR